MFRIGYLVFVYMFGYSEKSSSAVMNSVTSSHTISYGYTRKVATDTVKRFLWVSFIIHL